MQNYKNNKLNNSLIIEGYQFEKSASSIKEPLIPGIFAKNGYIDILLKAEAENIGINKILLDNENGINDIDDIIILEEKYDTVKSVSNDYDF